MAFKTKNDKQIKYIFTGGIWYTFDKQLCMGITIRIYSFDQDIFKGETIRLDMQILCEPVLVYFVFFFLIRIMVTSRHAKYILLSFGSTLGERGKLLVDLIIA